MRAGLIHASACLQESVRCDAIHVGGWRPGLPPAAAVVSAGLDSVRLQALLRVSSGAQLEEPTVVPDGWEVQCEGEAEPVTGSRSQWDLRLQLGQNDAVFRLRQSGTDTPGEHEAGDVAVRIFRQPAPPLAVAPVLSGFHVGGAPYGALVRQALADDAAAGDADVHWTLEFPAHGDGLQMLVPELAGGEQALPTGWALRVTCFDGDLADPEPSVHRHEGVHELQLPVAALGPGRSCVVKLVLANGEVPHGVTHIISIQRATLMLVRHLPLQKLIPCPGAIVSLIPVSQPF